MHMCNVKKSSLKSRQSFHEMDFCFLFLIIILTTSLSSCSPTEGQIMDKILTKYDKLTRPVTKPEVTMPIDIGLVLLQIIDVDEKHQILTINTWLRTYWTDIALVWDPLQYENITVVRLPANRVWSPDILLHYTADEDIFQSIRFRSEVNVYIEHNGRVVFVPPMVIKSACKIDVTWFPFDIQSCQVQFGSWTYSVEEIDLRIINNTSEAADTSEYTENGKWKLVEFTVKRVIVSYEEKDYILIIFTITIKRRILYYWYNLIVPAGLIGENILKWCDSKSMK